MEVATTGSMGSVLMAPRFPKAHWSYELVGNVRVGDRILHWQSGGTVRGLVGWSVAVSEPEVQPMYTWQPRGRAGRAHGPRTTEGWKVRLGGFQPLEDPLSSSALQGAARNVLNVERMLKAEHRGRLYFPFYRYAGGGLRTQQGYLMKFPSELLALFPTLESAIARSSAPLLQLPAREPYEDPGRPHDTKSSSGAAEVPDSEFRREVAEHARDKVVKHYRSLGGDKFEKTLRPFGVLVETRGERRSILVKGSTGTTAEVELTADDVRSARNRLTDLAVVDDIACSRSEDGTASTSGGRLRIWRDWAPGDADLRAVLYEYSLPPSGRERRLP